MRERTRRSDRLALDGDTNGYGVSSPPSADALSVFEPVEAPH